MTRIAIFTGKHETRYFDITKEGSWERACMLVFAHNERLGYYHDMNNSDKTLKAARLKEPGSVVKIIESRNRAGAEYEEYKIVVAEEP